MHTVAKTELDAEVKSYFAKYSAEASASQHFPLMELPEYNCEEALASDEVFYHSDNGYVDEDGVQLGKALAVLKPATLKQIYLTNQSGLGDVGVAGVAAGLSELQDMDVVHVVGSSMGDAGLAALAPAIKHLSLSKLVLTRNTIGDTGATALAVLLADPAHFIGLEWLYLDSCPVGDAGAAALGAALLSGCKSLARLALQGCAIGDGGMLALAAAINQGGMAQEGEFLYLQDNPCTKAGKQAVICACRGKMRCHLGWPPPNGGIAPEEYD